MNKVLEIKNFLEDDSFQGVLLEGIITKTIDDIIIGEKSLKEQLKRFFDKYCKTYWIGQLESQPESYAIRYFICTPDRKFLLLQFTTEWIGGNKGYDWIMENNENIFDLLSDYEGLYIFFIL